MALDVTWTYNNTGDTGYREAIQSGDAQFGADTGNATRIFRVNWGVHHTFIDDLLGYSYLTGASPSTINRILPDEHPLYNRWYAVEATVTGSKDNDTTYTSVGTTAGRIEHSEAIITAVYKSVDYPIKADGAVTHESQRYCTIQEQSQHEFMSINTTLKFVTSKRVLPSPGMTHSFIQRTVTWHQVPSGGTVDPYKNPVYDKIQSLAGKVNNDTFLGDPATSVLFLGAEGKMRMSSAASATDRFSWDITFLFGVKNVGTDDAGRVIGWNHFWDVESRKWDLATHDGEAAGNTLYNTGNLNNLFVIG